MLTTRIIAATLTAALLAACETPPSKEDIGMATGGLVGKRIGRNMDRSDQAHTMHALDQLVDGASTTWRNDETGARYWVTPTRTYSAGSADPCRDFTTIARIEGRDETVHGTACRQPDGTWKAL